MFIDSQKIYKYVVNYCISLLLKLNMSNRTLGIYLRSFHMNLPIYCIIAIIYGSKWVALLCIYNLCLAFIALWFFNGCILSKIEKKIDGEDVVIIDPFMHLLNIPINSKNRFNTSIVIGSIYMLSVFYIYYKRFINVYPTE